MRRWQSRDPVRPIQSQDQSPQPLGLCDLQPLTWQVSNLEVKVGQLKESSAGCGREKSVTRPGFCTMWSVPPNLSSSPLHRVRPQGGPESQCVPCSTGTARSTWLCEPRVSNPHPHPQLGMKAVNRLPWRYTKQASARDTLEEGHTPPERKASLRKGDTRERQEWLLSTLTWVGSAGPRRTDPQHESHPAPALKGTQQLRVLCLASPDDGEEPQSQANVGVLPARHSAGHLWPCRFAPTPGRGRGRSPGSLLWSHSRLRPPLGDE